MRRSILRGAGMLFLALACVWLALPPNVAAASSAKIIYSFAGGADGADPESDLLMDAAGNLYGTTNQGGIGSCYEGCGTVFELIRTKDGWEHQVLYSFAGGPNDGANPTAGLVFDSGGNLYGTTEHGGGSYNYGTVFKLAPDSHGGWSESILYSFAGSNGDGASPNTDLVFDSRGNLYGATSFGGGPGRGCFLGCGIVFKLTPNQDGTWTESTIYAFAGVTKDGSNPASAVVLDVDGNIYGATAYGGTETCAGGPFRGCGSVYKLTPNSGGGWTETLLYNFHRFQGTAKNPAGGFLFTTDGRVLGTSVEGGDRYGAFFQLEQTKKGWEQTVLYRFYGSPDGAYPVGRLAMGLNGNLYGVTAEGGANQSVGGGTVFELEDVSGRWKEHVLFSATNTAYNPQAGPTVDSHGHVYGTFAGGNDNFGAVYEIIP
jgi:uncharacterized repeat protein (TIGR03803 family)